MSYYVLGLFDCIKDFECYDEVNVLIFLYTGIQISSLKFFSLYSHFGAGNINELISILTVN